MTFLPSTSWVSYCPPGTNQVARAIRASRPNSRTKVLGNLSFMTGHIESSLPLRKETLPAILATRMPRLA